MAKVKKIEVSQNSLNQGLMGFIKASPSPFHCVSEIEVNLKEFGFESLDEGAQWKLSPGGKYYVIRNGSSIVAFSLGKPASLESGFRMVGAHTDSPCLKVKPNPDRSYQGFYQAKAEIYGGVLLNPWFDRDLSLAGRVTALDTKGRVCHLLVDFERAIATIPSLAIHLDREQLARDLDLAAKPTGTCSGSGS